MALVSGKRLSPYTDGSACEKKTEQQEESVRTVGSLTISLSLKGCSLFAIAYKDCDPVELDNV